MNLIINAQRQGYTTGQVSNTLTVGELIELLTEFDEDAKVYLSHDRGYTYGGINYEDVSLEENCDEEDH